MKGFSHPDAACRDRGFDLFFPLKGDELGYTAEARAICAGCPVKHDCLEAAVSENIVDGVWGGMTPSQRSKVRRKRMAGSRPPARHGTRACYLNGCRLPECREAHRVYQAKRKSA